MAGKPTVRFSCGKTAAARDSNRLREEEGTGRGGLGRIGWEGWTIVEEKGDRIK